MQRSVMAFAAMIVLASDTCFALELQQAGVTHRRSGDAPKPFGRTPRPARRKAVQAPELSPVQQKLQRDTTLAVALAQRLPAGTDLMNASSGFKDVGQFVAAVNASRTLGIPMRDFSRRMVGDGMPLLLALQDLRPRSNYRLDARRAEEEAAAMLGPEDASTLTLAKRQN
jgi:hypothetical protein